mmetsp:Transcript_20634/g.69036  ORF Transcript_20634/g.69036 Transcript_20634/m.69036 type:complete len:105 (-) Transcript_20634:1461-1775(-)
MCSGVPERQRGGRDPSRQDVCRLFIEWGGSTEGDGGHTYEEDKAFTERRGCMAGRIYSRNCDGATSPRGSNLSIHNSFNSDGCGQNNSLSDVRALLHALGTTSS